MLSAGCQFVGMLVQKTHLLCREFWHQLTCLWVIRFCLRLQLKSLYDVLCECVFSKHYPLPTHILSNLVVLESLLWSA